MNLDISAFALGAKDYLDEKQGSVNLLDALVNENILPSFNNQRNWRYAQTPEELRLSDGDRVYSFGLKDLGGETGRVAKLDDIPILDFETGKTRGGTAQIHRSSPDSIYLTLADGRDNPTFRLEHDSGKNWKYIPSKKMIKRLEQLRSHGDQKGPESVTTPKVNIESLMQGGADMAKSAGVGSFLFGDSVSSVADPTQRGLAVDIGLYSNPFTGVPTAAYDTTKHLMNGRYLSALGSVGMGALSFIPMAGSGVGAGVKGAVRGGAKVLGRAGQVGGAAAEAGGFGQKILSGAGKFLAGGNKVVNTGEKAISDTVHGLTGLKQAPKWEHGLQNPLSNGQGQLGLRSPLAPNFNLKSNLSTGTSKMIQNPATTTATTTYGMDYNTPPPKKSPSSTWKGDFMFKQSNFEGFFGTPDAAATAINSGASSVKNFLASALGAAGRNPVTTAGMAVGAGFGLNKLREAMSDEYREKMEQHPDKKINRELAIPLLGALGASALGNIIK